MSEQEEITKAGQQVKLLIAELKAMTKVKHSAKEDYMIETTLDKAEKILIKLLEKLNK